MADQTTVLDPEFDQKLSQFYQSDQNAPEIIGMIIVYAIDNGVSDILIEPGVDSGDVRMRIDGVLHVVTRVSNELYPSLISRIKIMAGLDITIHRTAQEGKIDFEHKGRLVNLRVAMAAVVTGESVAMRVHDTRSTIYKLEALGIGDTNLSTLTSLLNAKTGLLLVCGPTGHGKTTTLYSSLQTLNDGAVNIISIEDPIEYILPGINQMQVDNEHGLTFAEGLKVILRLNPDIIFVGEIRDAETAHIAIEAALTGHQVLTTMHANSAIAVLSRLIDLNIDKFLINAALAGSVSQRLVRKVCPYCQQDVALSQDHIELFYNITGQKIATQKVGTGCKACAMTGYKGRIGVYEVLPMTDILRNLISEGAINTRIEQTLKAHNFKNMLYDGLMKVAQGQTTMEEVIANCYVVD